MTKEEEHEIKEKHRLRTQHAQDAKSTPSREVFIFYF
jgi:hypothetical protein